MADRILCVSWNDHANEVAREWKSFLENNSFVDCTIAAEGKSLKAHRLILSACSPYFHMLFKEQNEKHPIVFLRDTSYHTLKSLIDFVYNGKVEIPAGQLEIFLELAVSLQINGLNNSFRNDRRINILDNAAEERPQCLSRVNRDNSGVENWRTSYENCFSNLSCQSHYQFLQDNMNSTQNAPPILFEGCDDSAEVVQSRAAMMAVQNHPLHDNPELLVSTEQSLKQEHLFSEIKVLETRSEVLDGVNLIESMPGNPEDEMNAMMAVQNHPVYDNPEVLVSTEQSLKQEHLFSEIKVLETRSEVLDGVNHIESMPGNPEDEMNAMMAVQYHPVHDNPEVFVSTEQSLKQEHLFSEIKILETRSEVLDGVNHIESMLGNPEDEMNHGCALAFEENLDQFSRSRESLHSNVNSALMILQQEQQRQQQHQEQQLQLQQEVNEQQLQQLQQRDEQQQPQPVTHSVCELSLAPDLTEQNNQSLPELSMPLSDEADDSKREESTNALDVPENDTEEMAEETELAHDKSLNGRSTPDLTEQNDHSLLELSMPLSDEANDSEREESTNALDVPRNETEEMADETELAHDKSLNGSSGAEGSPTPQDEDQEQDRGQAMPEGSANSVPRPTVASAPELQAHVRLIRMPTLKCRDCDAIFASSRALEDHKRQHSGPQPLRRGVCGASSTATSDLAPPTLDAERHRSKALALHKQRHKVERPHPCDVCGKAFTTAAAVALHQRRHKRERERTHPRDVSRKALVKAASHALHKRRPTRKGPLSCSVCGKVFTAQYNLIIHTRIHTGERPHVCSVCGKAFNDPRALTGHKRTHTAERPYSCDMCGKAFSQSWNLTVHKRTHSGERSYPCDVCGKAFIRSGHLTRHKRTHTGERTYSCDVCGKAFRHSANLAVHKRTHTGERPYLCSVCGKAFSLSCNLAVHKRTHTGERPYLCSVCGKAFKDPSALTGHKRTHTKELPYSCDVCGKAYTRSSSLAVHKRTHTGERSYSCDVCGKAYTRSSSLAVHKRTHTGERSYLCSVCGKAFKKSSTLTSHKLTHTGERPYSCDVCGKTFTHSSTLAVHKRTHTGERPYSCDVCGKTFTHSSALAVHKRTHTGELSYSCDACSLRFSSKSSMITHWQRTHVAK